MKYMRITLDVPVEDDEETPENWNWQVLLDTTHEVYVVATH